MVFDGGCVDVLCQVAIDLSVWKRYIYSMDKDLRDLHRVVSAIERADSEEEVVDVVVGFLEGVDGVRWYVVDQVSNSIVSRGVVGDEGLIVKDCLVEDAGECKVVQSGIKMVFRGSSGCGKMELGCGGACMCVPLFFKDARSPYVTYVFTLVSKDAGFFDVEVREKMGIVFSCASLAVRRMRLADQCRENSVKDYLTGLYNRRFLDEELELEFKKANAYGHKLSVLMVDVDHFKSINDTYGHKVGDLTLVHVVSVIGRSVRASDIVARYGGEEFAVVLPDTTKKSALEVAERMRKSLEDSVLGVGEEKLRITASFGLATYDDDKVESAEELLKLADKRLYEAKRLGRNRVVCD